MLSLWTLPSWKRVRKSSTFFPLKNPCWLFLLVIFFCLQQWIRRGCSPGAEVMLTHELFPGCPSLYCLPFHKYGNNVSFCLVSRELTLWPSFLTADCQQLHGHVSHLCQILGETCLGWWIWTYLISSKESLTHCCFAVVWPCVFWMGLIFAGTWEQALSTKTCKKGHWVVQPLLWCLVLVSSPFISRLTSFLTFLLQIAFW